MDAELSADGARLYYTVNRWNPFGPPLFSRFRLARRTGGSWRVDPSADRWFASINAPNALQYAAAISPDELELFFTRAPSSSKPKAPAALWISTRKSPDAPFDPPSKITGVEAFAEGPTLAPDGSLYFHLRQAGRFVIVRSERACPAR